MLSPELQRLDQNLNVIAEGNLELRDAFFNPEAIVDEGGIDPILRGLAKQVAQRLDPFIQARKPARFQFWVDRDSSNRR